jgi:hypothetical protein
MLELFYKESLFHHLRFGSMFQSARDPHRPFRLVLTPPSDGQPVLLPEPNSSLDTITRALLDRGHVLLKVVSSLHPFTSAHPFTPALLLPPSYHCLSYLSSHPLSSPAWQQAGDPST